ncbi:acyltransferase domain-containing protein [Nocardia sp. NPDC051463]|uniref:acyltransferase domain-containing protein n=1 Tax=Nocardia sp. NPDC051463 TaxID=3154845 RepID=UPI00344DFD77
MVTSTEVFLFPGFGRAHGTTGEQLMEDAIVRYRCAVADGRPLALLGHSLGFLAALVCAGAFTVDDGHHIIRAQEQAVRRYGQPEGGMVTLELDEAAAAKMAAEVGDPGLTVACINAPDRTVLSGPVAALRRVAEHAEQQDVVCVRLPIDVAYHSPMLNGVVAPLRAELDRIPQHRLRAPVYSATTHQFCSDDDDLLTAMVEALVLPVRFEDAVLHMDSLGAARYVECGPDPLLVKLVRLSLPGAERLPVHRTDSVAPCWYVHPR